MNYLSVPDEHVVATRAYWVYDDEPHKLYSPYMRSTEPGEMGQTLDDENHTRHFDERFRVRHRDKFDGYNYELGNKSINTGFSMLGAIKPGWVVLNKYDTYHPANRNVTLLSNEFADAMNNQVNDYVNNHLDRFKGNRVISNLFATGHKDDYSFLTDNSINRDVRLYLAKAATDGNLHANDYDTASRNMDADTVFHINKPYNQIDDDNLVDILTGDVDYDSNGRMVDPNASDFAHYAHTFFTNPRIPEWVFTDDRVWDQYVERMAVFDAWNDNPRYKDDGGQIKIASVIVPKHSIIRNEHIANGYELPIYDNAAYYEDYHNIIGGNDKETTGKKTKITVTPFRDFAEEGVATIITPQRFIENFKKARDNYYFMRKNGASGPEAFSNAFNYDAGYDLSDEAYKDVIRDASNFYNAECKKRKDTQSNIVDALM